MIVTMSEIEDLRLRRDELYTERRHLFDQLVDNSMEIIDVEKKLRESAPQEERA